MERKIAIYLRVSTFDQARNGYGLGDQKTQCMKYLDLYYPEEKNVEIFMDDGYSAKNLVRPAMMKMMQQVKESKIYMIIAFKLDRLTRSVVDTYELIKTVCTFDCSIVAVIDRIDISSANGRMLVGMLSVISQWEREVISERTLAGLTEMARKGKYPYGGKPPFGWDRVDGSLVVNEYNASILNYWATLYINGYSLVDISEFTKTKYGCSLSWQLIRKYLLRNINIGILDYHGQQYTDVVPAIMDKTLYEKVKECSKNREVHASNKKEYYYHNLVYCAGCNERLAHSCTVKHGKNGITIYRYYCCDKCNHRISQETMHKLMFPILSESISNDELKEQLDILDKKLKRNKKKKNELVNAYKRGSLELSSYCFSIDKLEADSIKLKNRMKSLSESLINFYDMNGEDIYKIVHKKIKRIEIDLNEIKIINIIYKEEGVG